MNKITYKSICDKLGFDVDTYEIPICDTEDDSEESPFSRLTFEELCFLTDRMKQKEN